jgi:hypothetical protein
MLIQRLIDVTFKRGQGNFSNGSNQVTVSGLRVSVQVEKGGGSMLSTLQMRIYGLSFSLMNELSTLGMRVRQVIRDSVTVTAGDANSGMGIVFIGTITNCYFDPEGMPNVSLYVSAQAGLYEVTALTEPTSYRGSIDVSTVMSNLAQRAGLTFENSGVSVILRNPYFTGSPLRQIQAAARAARINAVVDNGKLAIWPKLGSRNSAVPLIAPPPDGEMALYPTYTAQGLMIRSLYTKDVTFGGQVQVKSSLTPAEGLWNIYMLNYDLESIVPNGQWFMNIYVFNNKSMITEPSGELVAPLPQS